MPAAAPTRRKPGRPPLDPDVVVRGQHRVIADLTQAQADHLAHRLAEARKTNPKASRASVLRDIITADMRRKSPSPRGSM